MPVATPSCFQVEQQEDEPKEDWLKRVHARFVGYARVIDEVSPRDVKVYYDYTVLIYLEQCYYNVILKCDIIIIINIFNVGYF